MDLIDEGESCGCDTQNQMDKVKYALFVEIWDYPLHFVKDVMSHSSSSPVGKCHKWSRKQF